MPNHLTGVIPPEYRGAIRRRERRGGYWVVRTWLYATPNEGVARKTIGHLSFMVSAVLLGWRPSGSADVVVVSSPTFFSVDVGWLLARLNRARLVVEVRDLWPAIFTELGVLTNRRIIALLERLELAAYAAADTVIVVSEGFRANLIGRGVPAAKIHTIRNGVCPGEFDPAARPDPWLRARLGAGPGDCLVLYAGTHGISQGPHLGGRRRRHAGDLVVFCKPVAVAPAVARRHRQPAARPHHREPGPRPRRPGPVPAHHRPEPVPRPQDQGPARLPAWRPRHPHAHRTRPDQRLRHHSRLTWTPFTIRAVRQPCRQWNRPPPRSAIRAIALRSPNVTTAAVRQPTGTALS